MTENHTQRTLLSAVQHHQAGRLDAARALYERVLAADAANADALHLLGVVQFQRGDAVEAVRRISAAFALCPSPAIAANLILVLLDAGRPEAATAAAHAALALAPDTPDAWRRLGDALYTQGHVGTAAAAYRRALALQPAIGDVRNALGGALLALDRPDEAADVLYAALGLAPQDPDIRGNLGSALWQLGRPDAAATAFRTVLALRPDHAEALANLGNLLQEQGRPAAAEAAYRAAITVRPDYAKARFNRALLLLKRERFSEGMEDYQWRWKAKDFQLQLRRFAVPAWDGCAPPPGKLFIWSEQAAGDEVMLAGLIPDLLRLGIPCVLEGSPRLVSLFARSFPSVEVVPRPGNPRYDPLSFPGRPDVAAHVESGDLIPILRPTMAHFTTTTSPYMHADPALRARLRARYADGRLIAGLSWYSRNPTLGRRRSIAPEILRPLFAVPGVRWVSLQYGDPDALAEELAAAGMDIAVDRDVDTRADLDAFAAQLAAMDLVVTIDNTTAHFGGALGVPTWVLLDSSADWRWLEERTDSPWYPSVRLFRQTAPGDWAPVVERVARELAEVSPR